MKNILLTKIIIFYCFFTTVSIFGMEKQIEDLLAQQAKEYKKLEENLVFSTAKIHLNCDQDTQLVTLDLAKQLCPDFEFYNPKNPKNPAITKVRMIPIKVYTAFLNPEGHIDFWVPHEFLLQDEWHIESILKKNGEIFTHKNLHSYKYPHKSTLLKQIADKITNEHTCWMIAKNYDMAVLTNALEFEKNLSDSKAKELEATLLLKDRLIADLKSNIEEIKKTHANNIADNGKNCTAIIEEIKTTHSEAIQQKDLHAKSLSNQNEKLTKELTQAKQENENLKTTKRTCEYNASDNATRLQNQLKTLETNASFTKLNLENEKIAHLQTIFYKKVCGAALLVSWIGFLTYILKIHHYAYA